jgi:hypothetical protein
MSSLRNQILFRHLMQAHGIPASPQVRREARDSGACTADLAETIHQHRQDAQIGDPTGFGEAGGDCRAGGTPAGQRDGHLQCPDVQKQQPAPPHPELQASAPGMQPPVTSLNGTSTPFVHLPMNRVLAGNGVIEKATLGAALIYYFSLWRGKQFGSQFVCCNFLQCKLAQPWFCC